MWRWWPRRSPGVASDAAFALAGKRVFVAGHRGMVGQALLRVLAGEGCEVLTVSRIRLDLRLQDPTWTWLARHRPDVVIVAAATVGGIAANAAKAADFLFDNLMIEANLIEGARRAGVEKLLMLGSSCIYPRLAGQPITEDALLSGPLEPTNAAYALAKIAGVKLAAAFRAQHGCDFICALPCNLYGPGDRFDAETGHVLAALILKAHRARIEGARELVVWGSGAPLREFLHVDDCASALLLLLQRWSSEAPVNVGSGEEISVADLARLVCEVVGFGGTIGFDPTRPDGTPRKLLDASRLRALGWTPRIGLREGIAATYRWAMENGRL
ncbi:MAG: GDP-L-fucose synthase family protein [Candidatus Dormibacteria bacterium]